MPLEHVCPTTLAQLGGCSRGLCDVEEQYACERPVWLATIAGVGEKFFDLCRDLLMIPCEKEVIHTRHLDVLRIGNVVGEVPGMLDPERPFVTSMENQGWNVDRGQDRPNIDLP